MPRGRPFADWEDWKGQRGTVYQMCALHEVTRAALYKRAQLVEKGRWFLPAPRPQRRGDTDA